MLNKNKKKPVVSLIFPVYNNAEMTRAALQSLKEVNAGIEYEVILVDDASTEDMSSVYKDKSLYDVLIQLEKNTGNSTENVNIGIKHASGEYVQYQNTDVLFVQENWLLHIVEAFNSNHKIAVVGAKTIYPDGRVNHSMRSWIFDDQSQSQSHHERGVRLPESSKGINECQLVGGCGMTTRKALWKENGGFHIYKPFGWDDADWCFRMLREGFKVVCQSDSYFVHFGSVSYGGKETPEYYKNKELIESQFGEIIKKTQV